MKANVYTVLVALTAMALIACCVIVGSANYNMTRDLQVGTTPHPFYIMP